MKRPDQERQRLEIMAKINDTLRHLLGPVRMPAKWGDVTPEEAYQDLERKGIVKPSDVCKLRNRIIDRRNFVNRLRAAHHWETKPIPVWEIAYTQYEQEIYFLVEESKRLEWGDK